MNRLAFLEGYLTKQADADTINNFNDNLTGRAAGSEGYPNSKPKPIKPKIKYPKPVPEPTIDKKYKKVKNDADTINNKSSIFDTEIKPGPSGYPDAKSSPKK